MQYVDNGEPGTAEEFCVRLMRTGKWFDGSLEISKKYISILIQDK